MKHQFKPSVFLIFMFISTFSFSQEDDIDYKIATVTVDYCVQLDAESAAAEHYAIDISHLHLGSELEATKKFGFISNNLLTYTVDFSEERAYLHVHLDRTSSPKDIVWWNEYLTSLCGL